MSRLPVPGKDTGQWGDILNDYLGQAHNNDGSLKTIPQSKVTDLTADLAVKADTASLATVATSGSYTDLTSKPTIPAAQVSSDWNATSGITQILNKPTIPTQAGDVGAAATTDLTALSTRVGTLEVAKPFVDSTDSQVLIFTLDVASAVPLITLQPSSVTVARYSLVTFQAAASGTPIPTCQWFRSDDNGSSWAPISGATSGTYTVTPQSTGDNSRTYHAVFSNSAGSVTSQTATVTVNPTSPSITTQPVAASVSEGNAVSFSADASGDPNPTVQWQRSTNGTTWTNISGATSSTYATPVLAVADSGTWYRALFTNSAGTVTSTAVQVTVTAVVLAAPTVVTDPLNSISVNEGSTATFTAVINGTPTPTYQWQQSTDGGTTYGNIPGATNTSYTTPTLSMANDSTFYRVTATNSQGTVTTARGTLYVYHVPVIMSQPLSISTTVGSTAKFVAADSDVNTATYQWQQSTDGGTTWNSGNTLKFYSVANVQTTNNGLRVRTAITYAMVDGSHTMYSNAATLTVTTGALTAPVITTQPVSATATHRTVSVWQAFFTVIATGFPSPTYQWEQSTDGGTTWGNAAVTPSYGGTLHPNLLSASDNGTKYRCVVTNGSGSVTSNVATLTVGT